ncbi:MAG: phage integrase SAM-like domain-containing protein [Cytophagaceae bacterium]
MIQVSFYLKRPNSLKSPVYLDINFDGNRIQLATGLAIEPEYWNKEKKSIKNNYKDSIFFKRIMGQMQDTIQEYYLLKRTKGDKIQRDDIKRLINSQTTIKENGNIEDVSFFKRCTTEYLESKSITQTKRSIQVYKQVLNDIEEFASENKIKLSFDNLDATFFDKYHKHLLSISNTNSNRNQINGFTNDTIYKRISNIKSFLKWALERGYHSNIDYQRVKIKKSQKNEIVSLSLHEFQILENLDLQKNKRLERVRDLFLFGVYTGQRWSDVTAFRKEDIKDNSWRFYAQKTRKLTVVPFVGFCANAYYILEKYDFKLPEISGQKFNLYLKEVGQLANLDEHIVITRFSGTQKIIIEGHKHEFMSSHMARRTCVNILLELGTPPTTVMKLTGHADLKTLLKYENTSLDSLKNALIKIKI